MTQDNRLMDQVSVVICAKDREKLIEQTLKSVVLNQPAEIVVIDDCSTDRTADVANRFTDKVVRSAGKGLAAARQLGAETAQNRYIAYVDSDVVLTEGCLAALAQVLESDATIGGVQPIIQSPDAHSYWERCEQAGRVLQKLNLIGDRDAIGCTVAMYRRELILEHRFDPFFVGAGEDIDFSRRLFAAGWRLYRTDTVAYHHSRDSLVEIIKQRFWYGRGAVRLAIRNARPNASAPQPQAGAFKPHKHKIHWSPGMLPFMVISGVAYQSGRAFEWVVQKLHRP